MAWCRSVLLAVAVLVASALVVAPAAAKPGTERDGDHWPVSANTTVPAGGSSMITTPALGKDVKTIKVTVAPQQGATADEKDSADHLTSALGAMSKGDRLLLCIFLHHAVANSTDNPLGDYQDNEVEFRLAMRSQALLLLGACLRVTGLIAARQGPEVAMGTRARATQACATLKPSVASTLEKVDGGYELTVDGEVKKTKNPKLRVGCRDKGHKLIYKVRAAKKGVPLRRAVGKGLSIGLQSPADAETAAPVTVTFATP